MIDSGDVPISFRCGGENGIGTNGVLENRGGTLRLFGTQIDGVLLQSGGIFQSSTPIFSGSAFLTNAMITIYGSMRITFSGEFQQIGGTNNVPSLACSGTYRLREGILNANEMNLGIYGWGGSFYESGGTVTLSNLAVGYSARIGGGRGEVFLEMGTLLTASATVGPEGRFSQTGGLLKVGNQLTLSGWSERGGTRRARYTLDTGCMEVADLLIDSGEFFQNGGTNNISGSLVINPDRNEGKYVFSGGQLTASNILVSGTFSCVGSNGSHKIINPGYFALSGVFRSGGNSEQLGRFQLFGSPTIDLGLSGTLRFADSSGVTWDGGWGAKFTLTISNWTGSLDGSGNTQLFFGTNSSGLTPTQITQIQFVNPGGLPAGLYRAKILPTGEVVPVTDKLFFSMQKSQIILTWFGPYRLQVATEVEGPYVDVPEAISPYTNAFSTSPQRFFQLQR